MNDKSLMRRGLVGSGIAALCCFTPILVVLVAGVGLSAIIGWLDFALFPLLFTSLGVVAQAVWIQAGRPGRSPKYTIVILAIVLSVLLIWLRFRFALPISAAAALGVLLYSTLLRRKGAEAIVTRSNT